MSRLEESERAHRRALVRLARNLALLATGRHKDGRSMVVRRPLWEQVADDLVELDAFGDVDEDTHAAINFQAWGVNRG